MKSIGIDFGSLSTKAVLLDDAGQIERTLSSRTGETDFADLNAFLDGIDGREALTAGIVGFEADRQNQARRTALRGDEGAQRPVHEQRFAPDWLFINVGKIVDFARSGADGVINAICFNCTVGNASAAAIEKIRRDHDNIPIVSAVYAGGENPSRRIVLEAFVSQVIAHHEKRAAHDLALS